MNWTLWEALCTVPYVQMVIETGVVAYSCLSCSITGGVEYCDSTTVRFLKAN